MAEMEMDRRQFLKAGILGAGATVLGGFRNSEAQTVDEENRRRIEFENELFRNGKLDFYKTHFGHTIQRMENAGEDKERITQTFNQQVKYQPDCKWMYEFNGEIPRNWSYWIYVYDDFREAREQKVFLSHTLVDAGIAHPQQMVVNQVGKGQRLGIEQMAKIFTRSDIHEWNLNEILAAQRQMDVKDNDIQKARQMADDARRQKKAK